MRRHKFDLEPFGDYCDLCGQAERHEVHDLDADLEDDASDGPDPCGDGWVPEDFPPTVASLMENAGIHQRVVTMIPGAPLASANDLLMSAMEGLSAYCGSKTLFVDTLHQRMAESEMKQRQ